MSTVRDDLARERTFLAWIRTAVALLGFGFVIVKFDVMIGELGVPVAVFGGGHAVTLAGGVVAVLAAIRYLVERRNPDAAPIRSPWLPVAVSALVVVLSVYLATQMNAVPRSAARAGPPAAVRGARGPAGG